MPTLIACLSSGKGTWMEVTQIIQQQPWQQVFLITDQFGKERFTARGENIAFILINPFQPLEEVKKAIFQQLQGKITDFEVGLNFVSGSGKEHMALLQAVMELGLNFRLVGMANGQVSSLGMDR